MTGDSADRIGVISEVLYAYPTSLSGEVFAVIRASLAAVLLDGSFEAFSS